MSWNRLPSVTSEADDPAREAAGELSSSKSSVPFVASEPMRKVSLHFGMSSPFRELSKSGTVESRDEIDAGGEGGARDKGVEDG